MAVGHPFTCGAVVCPRCSRTFYLPSNPNIVSDDRARGVTLLKSASLTQFAKLDVKRFRNEQEVQQALEGIKREFRNLHARLISDTKATFVKGTSEVGITYFMYYADPNLLNKALMDLQTIVRRYESCA